MPILQEYWLLWQLLSITMQQKLQLVLYHISWFLLLIQMGTTLFLHISAPLGSVLSCGIPFFIVSLYHVTSETGVIIWRCYRSCLTFIFCQANCSYDNLISIQFDVCSDVRAKAFQATEQFLQSVKEHSKVWHCWYAYSGSQEFPTVYSCCSVK